MLKFDYEKPVPLVCINCHKDIIGIRDMNGKTRVRCPYCGTITVSQVMSRRHIHADYYAPEGQSIIQ